MLEKMFGIMRRAYYFSASVLSIIFVIYGISWLPQFNNRGYGSSSDYIGNIGFGILIIPIAIGLHRLVHWIIWGKFKVGVK
jgi:hypothetical protein